jgi:hypothetical protein
LSNNILKDFPKKGWGNFAKVEEELLEKNQEETEV